MVDQRSPAFSRRIAENSEIGCIARAANYFSLAVLALSAGNQEASRDESEEQRQFIRRIAVSYLRDLNVSTEAAGTLKWRLLRSFRVRGISSDVERDPAHHTSSSAFQRLQKQDVMWGIFGTTERHVSVEQYRDRVEIIEFVDTAVKVDWLRHNPRNTLSQSEIAGLTRAEEVFGQIKVENLPNTREFLDLVFRPDADDECDLDETGPIEPRTSRSFRNVLPRYGSSAIDIYALDERLTTKFDVTSVGLFENLFWAIADRRERARRALLGFGPGLEALVHQDPCRGLETMMLAGQSGAPRPRFGFDFFKRIALALPRHK